MKFLEEKTNQNALFLEHILHGADYNPDQWLHRPDILAKDIELMKESGCNVMSIGMFAWVTLEPEEGVYRTEWLREVVDNLYKNGIYTFLATPTAARPAWMAQKYPEVLRVTNNLHRNSMGERHNHCYSSPIYREKTKQINTVLVHDLGDHPGVVLWHLSNEYGGECFCDICQENFRLWLKERYDGLEKLNHSWWTKFWSHEYTDWNQIEAPIPQGETNTHGLNLDWRRFVSHMTTDFCRFEVKTLRDAGSTLPTTTNFMHQFKTLNYFELAEPIDIISWDAYPDWSGVHDNTPEAIRFAFDHDLMRSLKKQQFLLMESTPSLVNWKPVNKLKRPKLHMLSSLQAVAHGSNSVQYFQWRKSRGASEKLHGAVVDHYGESDTRVFRDVAELGRRLGALGGLAPTNVKAQVAIVFDWENWWAVENAATGHKGNMQYINTVLSHYQAFWDLGINVDILDMEQDFSEYAMVVTPLLYLYRGKTQENLTNFVAQGGTLVSGYFSGVVDETDLAFLGGTPGGMMDVFGIRTEELDALDDGDHNATLWGGKTYEISRLCELVKVLSASVEATYQDDFYAGMATITKNAYIKGQAYYITAQLEDAFYLDFYRQLTDTLGVKSGLSIPLPYGVTVSTRHDKTHSYPIVQNFNNETIMLNLKEPMEDFETGESVSTLVLAPYDCRILKRSLLF